MTASIVGQQRDLGRKIPCFGLTDAPWKPRGYAGKTRLIGQDAILNAIYEFYQDQAKLPHPTKALMVIGQPGVGKTNLFDLLESDSVSRGNERTTANL